jgi:hypothetical protein
VFHPCFLHGLLFDPEDGDDMFFRNVCWLSLDYTAFISENMLNVASKNMILGQHNNCHSNRSANYKMLLAGRLMDKMEA